MFLNYCRTANFDIEYFRLLSLEAKMSIPILVRVA